MVSMKGGSSKICSKQWERANEGKRDAREERMEDERSGLRKHLSVVCEVWF